MIRAGVNKSHADLGDGCTALTCLMFTYLAIDSDGRRELDESYTISPGRINL